MKHSLTVVMTTAREKPCVEWFEQSLAKQNNLDNRCNVKRLIVIVRSAKPNIWQGAYRVTQQDWWAKSNALNTGICLCRTEWIAFIDDRSVVLPGWLDCIAQAMEGGYAVCGRYEKRTGMTVENGEIKNEGTVIGKDSRIPEHVKVLPKLIPHAGQWCYGCSVALPLEWALECNGFDETCDGLGAEDTVFGRQINNNGHPWKFDTRMMMIEDRTPGVCGPVMRREDKGFSPNDKSHALNSKLNGLKRALNLPCGWDLRKIREDVLAGKPFPIPPKQKWLDWFDGQPIEEMT
jgi:hypothetical protein